MVAPRFPRRAHDPATVIPTRDPPRHLGHFLADRLSIASCAHFAVHGCYFLSEFYMASGMVFLEFEAALAQLDEKVESLRFIEDESAVSLSETIDEIVARQKKLTKEIYAKLTPWQIVQVARHPKRPYTLDYVGNVFTDYHELHGDRTFADDQSIVGGLARLNGNACMVIGNQKGRDTKERTARNFGYPRPEGYRKALRLMKLAEKFSIPVFTFIDTPGAWPGIDAEERGQSEAIGRNLYEMAKLRVPIIATVIGEGGSGGALAIGVSDVMQMFQYATYSVISPEACSTILWRHPDKQKEAAEALALTAHRLKALGLIDKILPEPLGGAHREPVQAAATLKKALLESFRQIGDLPIPALLERRHQRLMSYGVVRELDDAS